MVEHHLIACSDFAPARKVLSETLLFLFGHLSCSPLYLLLHGAETLDLAQPALNRLLAVVIGLALIGAKEDELDGGDRLFKPVKPVVIHLGKNKQEEAGQRHCGQGSNADAVKRYQPFRSGPSDEALETEPDSNGRHENAEGCHHCGAGGEIPGGRGNKTETADNETQSPAENQSCGYGSSEKGSDGRGDNQVGKNQQHSRDLHRAGNDKAEGSVEEEVPPTYPTPFAEGCRRIEGNLQQRSADRPVDCAHNPIQKCQGLNFPQRYG